MLVTNETNQNQKWLWCVVLHQKWEGCDTARARWAHYKQQGLKNFRSCCYRPIRPWFSILIGYHFQHIARLIHYWYFEQYKNLYHLLSLKKKKRISITHIKPFGTLVLVRPINTMYQCDLYMNPGLHTVNGPRLERSKSMIQTKPLLSYMPLMQFTSELF